MADKNSSKNPVSLQAIKRMPFYLQHLRKLQEKGVEKIAAPAIAESLSLNEVQVRKDFAAVSQKKGKPKAGFEIDELISDMEEFLGYRNVRDAVLVGTGSLGKALMSYPGFDNYGVNIVVGFDENSKEVGSEINEKPVLPASQISEVCRRLKVKIGIITVPADKAQPVCDKLVAGGVKAIWNFAPTHISAPDDILIQNENMAASLAILSKHLEEKLGI